LIQARSAIAAFVETVYNRQRLHSALDYRQCEATMRTIVIFNVTKLEGLIQRENRVRNTKFITKNHVKREKNADQVDRCFWFYLSRRNFGPSTDIRAHSSAEWHDHTSRFRLRAGPDDGQWRLRGQNYHPSNPASRPQVCAMVRGHLRSVRVKRDRTGVRSITNRTPVPLL
jgi:hypothetical protein